MNLVGRFPMVDYAGDLRQLTIEFELWRVGTSAPGRVEEADRETLLTPAGNALRSGLCEDGWLYYRLKRAARVHPDSRR